MSSSKFIQWEQMELNAGHVQLSPESSAYQNPKPIHGILKFSKCLHFFRLDLDECVAGWLTD